MTGKASIDVFRSTRGLKGFIRPLEPLVPLLLVLTEYKVLVGSIVGLISHRSDLET